MWLRHSILLELQREHRSSGRVMRVTWQLALPVQPPTIKIFQSFSDSMSIAIAWAIVLGGGWSNTLEPKNKLNLTLTLINKKKKKKLLTIQTFRQFDPLITTINICYK